MRSRRRSPTGIGSSTPRTTTATKRRSARRSGAPTSIAATCVITTKLPGRHHGFDETLASFEQSRKKLDLDWVDLYLIHWPLPRVDKYVDSWRAMISLREKGLVRSIGVSNFTADMLTRLIDETSVVPVVNQVELHPYFPQAELRAFHDEHDIRTESWSPLAKRSDLMQEPVIVELAAAHGVTPAQVVLRWHVELGAVPIPKSSDAARRRANLDVFGFALRERRGRRDLRAVARTPVGRRPRHARGVLRRPELPMHTRDVVGSIG